MSVYLDWAATSPPDEAILAETLEISRDHFGNPSSIHRSGAAAAGILTAARDRCAAALNCPANTLYFTSGGTEANHIPLLSLLTRPVRGTIAISAIEHPSIREQAAVLAKCGWKVATIPVDRDGFITPEAVLATIDEETSFVAVMAVNNETGAIQPVSEIATALTRVCAGKRKPHFHVDFVQAAGKIPLMPALPGVDSASFSAHKLRGPRGIGLLYLARQIEPFIRGGGQERTLRPGTENIAGAHALSRCLEMYGRPGEPAADLVTIAGGIPGLSVIPETRTEHDPRFSPWIIQCTNDHLPGEVLVRILSDEGIYVSTGSACSSKKGNRPVLDAMGVSKTASKNAFRISTGPETTRNDLEEFSEKIAQTLTRY